MSVFKIAIVAAMGVTVAVLALGLVSMARGGEFAARYGNLLMRLRVACQGVAVVLAIAMMLLVAYGLLDEG
jgi:hypothetical protein